MRARREAYRRGWLAVSKLPAPVISVGNLTTGGTGKTPLVDWICRQIARDGHKVCILTRGYGRINPRHQVVVSNGTQIMASEREAGDEPYLLAQNLLGVAAVICNPNRAEGGEWAIENLGSEVFVLDDGFQHLRLARDLDIVTVDATNPWGGGALLPQGSLREPPNGLSRAGAIVITRTEAQDDLDSLERLVESYAGQVPIFTSKMLPTAVRLLANNAGEDPSAPFAAFCGVGNAESFFRLLRREGHELAFTRAFPDHHEYTQSEIDDLIRVAKAQGAGALVTTAKDEVKVKKLNVAFPCSVLDIQISLDEAEVFAQLIRSAIS
jgi:tetraacyldisaccharide 4'-kinase